MGRPGRVRYPTWIARSFVQSPITISGLAVPVRFSVKVPLPTMLFGTVPFT